MLEFEVCRADRSQGRMDTQARTTGKELKPRVETKTMPIHVASGTGGVGVLQKLNTELNTPGETQELEKLKQDPAEGAKVTSPAAASSQQSELAQRDNVWVIKRAATSHLPSKSPKTISSGAHPNQKHTREFWKNEVQPKLNRHIANPRQDLLPSPHLSYSMVSYSTQQFIDPLMTEPIWQMTLPQLIEHAC